MKKALLLLTLIVCAFPVASQTASEIEKEVGQPMLAYSVSEHIWMTPDFAANGQVCRMRFYPKRFDRGTVYVDDGHLTFPELKWVLNQIVPPASRGSRKSAFGIGPIGGGIAEADYEYEKVTFTFIDSFRITIDPKSVEQHVWRDFPAPARPKALPPPSESDFDEHTKAEIVVLRWNDRVCPQDDDDARPDYQRVAEIEQRFGPPQKIYSVGEFMSMSAAFAANGQVCQMWVYPKRVSGGQSFLGTKLEFGEVKSFLNLFVPPEERGLKQNVNFGTTATGGGSAWTTYPYEKVYITFMSSFPLQKYEGPLLRKGEFAFPIPKSLQAENKDRSASLEDIRRVDDAQVVTVRWLKRTCAQ